MGILSTVLNFVPGGSMVSGAIELGKKWLSGEQKENKLEKELESQKLAERAKTERALIKRSSKLLRILSFGILVAPFVAPIFPGVAVHDVAKYFSQAVSAVPNWWIIALQTAYAAIWAGAEVRNLRASGEDRRLAEKAAEKEVG